jgi:uracil-DNA glycosylase family 4
MSSPAAAMRELKSALYRCERCDALVRCRSRVVPGDGCTPATVAFVGIAPGRLGGDCTGIPFSGDRSGFLLREMIARAGLRRVFITNLVRCNPRDTAGRNRDPDAIEIANCREHLRGELAIVRPRVIACLGRIVWRELAGRGAEFTPEHPAPRRAGRAMLYPMYHPAYVNRGAYPAASYLRDFRRLARAVSAISQSVLS